jgi:hypothetical protein
MSEHPDPIPADEWRYELRKAREEIKRLRELLKRPQTDMKLADCTEADFRRIHQQVCELLAAETGLLFSGRQAIANEVVMMLQAAQKDGLHILTEHLQYQEAKHDLQ